MRLPEYSQPLTTILQIAITAVLKSWGIEWKTIVGHSSGEIAGAVAAGQITAEEAVKVAYYRGLSPSTKKDDQKALGMLALGIGPHMLKKYLTGASEVDIACFNSPTSVTLSGARNSLKAIQDDVQKDGFFARMLLVDLAYHSRFMAQAGTHYANLLDRNCTFSYESVDSSSRSMFSSVTGKKLDGNCDTSYWVRNMTSPVMFSQAVEAMLIDTNTPEVLIEIGPHGALAGPLSQIKQSLAIQGCNFEYLTAYGRDISASSLFDLAGKLFVIGSNIDLTEVNRDTETNVPRVIVDLPNYHWNHSNKFWVENTSSKDWRFRKFLRHDLLGSKILGVPWNSPVWRNSLGVDHAPWLRDHKVSKHYQRHLPSADR